MGKQFGKTIRQRREELELLQRQVAAHLEIDTPMLSKIERGERPVKKEQVRLFAEILQMNADNLQTIWLADKITDLLEDEELALRAMQMAEEEVKYQSLQKTPEKKSRKKKRNK